jgi:hypothetical protein
MQCRFGVGNQGRRLKLEKGEKASPFLYNSQIRAVFGKNQTCCGSHFIGLNAVDVRQRIGSSRIARFYVFLHPKRGSVGYFLAISIWCCSIFIIPLGGN